MKGLLFSFDGLDSSGKATQAARLATYLSSRGHKVHEFQTPDYTTSSGKELKLRLQGKLGDWNATSWQEKMGYFAANRAEHREEVIRALAAGDIVIYDRYVPSSIAFITVEASGQGGGTMREEVQKAVEELEYADNGMPKQDISLFLDVPPRMADAMLNERKAHRGEENEYTDHLSVQERLYKEYRQMFSDSSDAFVLIPCVEGDRLLSIAEVGQRVHDVLIKKYPHL